MEGVLELQEDSEENSAEPANITNEDTRALEDTVVSGAVPEMTEAEPANITNEDTRASEDTLVSGAVPEMTTRSDSSEDNPEAPVVTPIVVNTDDPCPHTTSLPLSPHVSLLVPDAPTYTELMPVRLTPQKRTQFTDSPRHAKVRKIATTHYLAAANRQQVNFDSKSNKNSIDVGTNVAISIDSIDRTNTSAKILPCKVMDINNQWCTLYSTTGILDTKFHSDTLTILNNVSFPELEETDPNTLPLVKLTTAVRAYSGWTSITTGSSICKCKTGCKTGRCPCKNNSLKCGTKCHRNMSCQNV